MATGDFVIVGVVGGGDFDGASAKGGVGVLIGDDGDFAIGEGKFDFFANYVFVSGVLWVDGYGGVTKESFGAGGADDDFLGIFCGVD